MLSFIRIALVMVFHHSNSNSNEDSGLPQVGGHQQVIQCQMVNCENMYTSSIKCGFNSYGPYEELYMSAITIPEKKTQAMNLKENRKGYMGGFRGRRGKQEMLLIKL